MNNELLPNETEKTFNKKIEESCEKLSFIKNYDNVTKRNILIELHNVILSADEDLFQRYDLNSLLETITKEVCFLLADESEKCRELSAAILKDVFRIICIESCLKPLMGILSQRLSKTDEKETSEEIRLLEIDLLHLILSNFSGDLSTCINDISTVLSFGLVDSCPDVKRRSCECITILANKQKKHFPLVAKTFFKPLLRTMSHQHLKTRALCVQSLDCIIDYLDNTEVVDALSHLSQRLFDRSPQVRLAVTETVGNMLVSLTDRYSYFLRLIPLMLSTLHDEVDNIRFKANDLWNKAGQQYLSENEKDYKDLIDFPSPQPQDFPDIDGQPPLGCRILVQRNVFHILPALVNDMRDWTPDTRLKSTKVLYSLLLHAENKITMQLTTALEGVTTSANDSSKDVVDQGIRCAELLGYFIEPSHLFESILCLIHQNVTAANLSILAAAIRGHKKVFPEDCFLAVCKFLANPDANRFREAPEQANLLLCIESLLSTRSEINSTVGYDIFVVLTSVSGLTRTDIISSKKDYLLQQLSQLQSCSVEELFRQHSIPLIKTLTKNQELWTYQNPELPIFINLIKSGYMDEELLLLILPILLDNLQPSKDAKLRSKVLALLTTVFQKLTPDLQESLSDNLLELVRSGIFPNLEWAAGRTAGKLRTVAAASLFEILNKTSKRKDMLKSIGKELLPVTSTLSDDDEAATRLLSCKILEVVLPDLVGAVEDLKIHTTCYDLIRCMDDESDNVRLMTLKVLRAYVGAFPQDYEWRAYHAYLKHLYENVLIHMDDKNERVKQDVFYLLTDIAFAGPDILLDELASKRFMMNASEQCDKLAEYITKMKL